MHNVFVSFDVHFHRKNPVYGLVYAGKRFIVYRMTSVENTRRPEPNWCVNFTLTILLFLAATKLLHVERVHDNAVAFDAVM